MRRPASGPPSFTVITRRRPTDTDDEALRTGYRHTGPVVYRRSPREYVLTLDFLTVQVAKATAGLKLDCDEHPDSTPSRWRGWVVMLVSSLSGPPLEQLVNLRGAIAMRAGG